jgi:5-methyltetrahydrofolate--homocysteine methyltransferase
LKPILAGAGSASEGNVVLGTVEGDVHDIGINLVGMMLEGAGFDVIQLGADTSPEEFVQAVKDNRPDILGMSALLTTTMVNMKDVIGALKDSGLRDSVKVMVGGATLNQKFADECGADGYAPDAAQASVLAKKLIKEQ